MIKEKRREKVIIYIDGGNFYHRIKKMFGDEKKDYDFDFEKFIIYLAGDRELIESYYYTTYLDINYDPEKYAEQQRFLNYLRRIKNFNVVVSRRQKVRIDGKIIYQSKEDDIRLALGITELTEKYNTAILVSGDGDFVPAVETVQRKGKQVENVSFEKQVGYHLKKVCNKFRKLKKEEVSRFFKKKEKRPKKNIK